MTHENQSPGEPDGPHVMSRRKFLNIFGPMIGGLFGYLGGAIARETQIDPRVQNALYEIFMETPPNRTPNPAELLSHLPLSVESYEYEGHSGTGLVHLITAEGKEYDPDDPTVAFFHGFSTGGISGIRRSKVLLEEFGHLGMRDFYGETIGGETNTMDVWFDHIIKNIIDPSNIPNYVPQERLPEDLDELIGNGTQVMLVTFPYHNGDTPLTYGPGETDQMIDLILNLYGNTIQGVDINWEKIVLYATSGGAFSLAKAMKILHATNNIPYPQNAILDSPTPNTLDSMLYTIDNQIPGDPLTDPVANWIRQQFLEKIRSVRPDARIEDFDATEAFKAWRGQAVALTSQQDNIVNPRQFRLFDQTPNIRRVPRTSEGPVDIHTVYKTMNPGEIALQILNVVYGRGMPNNLGNIPWRNTTDDKTIIKDLRAANNN